MTFISIHRDKKELRANVKFDLVQQSTQYGLIQSKSAFLTIKLIKK